MIKVTDIQKYTTISLSDDELQTLCHLLEDSLRNYELSEDSDFLEYYQQEKNLLEKLGKHTNHKMKWLRG